MSLIFQPVALTPRVALLVQVLYIYRGPKSPFCAAHFFPSLFEMVHCDHHVRNVIFWRLTQKPFIFGPDAFKSVDVIFFMIF